MDCGHKKTALSGGIRLSSGLSFPTAKMYGSENSIARRN